VLHDKTDLHEAERSGVAMRLGCSITTGIRSRVQLREHINTWMGARIFRASAWRLTRTINYAGQQMGLFQNVKENLTGDDVREGLVR